MAKKPPKPTRNGAPKLDNGQAPASCYILSLSVENVRCFGPKQTLDFTDGKGNPAQWTIILGENGTGKTTLLQILTGFELLPTGSIQYKGERSHIPRFHFKPFQGVPSGDGRLYFGLARGEDYSLSAVCRMSFALRDGLRSSASGSTTRESQWDFQGLLTISKDTLNLSLNAPTCG